MDLKKERKKILAEMRAERAATPKDAFDAIDAGLEKPEELDKFQIATARFIDTLHGYLSGNHPATSFDNARATCELINGITEHFKKKGLLPSSISLIYSRKNSTDEEPSVETRLTDEMYQKSRKRSNFAKHADKDAHKALSYDAEFDLDHFIFNMAHDYETLHCALINNGLIDNANEKLYVIERSLLNETYNYRQIYYPEYDVPNHGEASSNPMVDLQIRFLRAIELDREGKDCSVPAGAAACTIFRNKDWLMLEPEGIAQKIQELGIWPVNTQTNARIIRKNPSKPENNCEL